MNIDWGIAANFITVLVYILGGVRFLNALSTRLNILSVERDAEHKANLEKFNSIAEQLRKLTDVIVQLARQEERLEAIDQRMGELATRMNELKQLPPPIKNNRRKVS